MASKEEIVRSSTGERRRPMNRHHYRRPPADGDRHQIDASQQSLGDSSRTNHQTTQRSQGSLGDSSFQEACGKRHDCSHAATCAVCRRLQRFGVSREEDVIGLPEEEETTRRISRGGFTPSFEAMGDIDFDAWLLPSTTTASQFPTKTEAPKQDR